MLKESLASSAGPDTSPGVEEAGMVVVAVGVEAREGTEVRVREAPSLVT
jgi:hypothetical protein